MKFRHLSTLRNWIVLLIVILAIGCTQIPGMHPVGTIEIPPASEPELMGTADFSNVKSIAQTYLDAWKVEDYTRMYSLLTSISKDAFSEEEFIEHYQSIAIEAALTEVNYEILSVLVNPESAQVRYRMTLSSILVGDITRDTVMNLRTDYSQDLGVDQWRIEWDDTLVLPELREGNFLVMNRGGYVPTRANIYDRHGLALVAQADSTAIGLYPDQVDPTKSDQVFSRLSELTGVSIDTIRNLYSTSPSGAGWYIPLGEVSADVMANQLNTLAGLSGIMVRPYKSRYYFEGGIAPHVIGYVSAIQPNEVNEYKRKGYQQDERIGRSGLEKWGEKYLAGKRGGALYVFNAQGQPVTRLAESSAQPSQAIYTTIDRDFQLAAQQAISKFRGAIVVLERDTGRILALVSSPGFDPNAFEPINYNSSQVLFSISSDPSQPLFNRATQGQYPLGSVFKIITMSAALETGIYTPVSTYQCGYFFDELPGARFHDWTYDYFLQNGKTIPSGLLTLPEGLIRSCNPFFWHIGLDLYNRDLTTAVSQMARGFGLSSPAGIVGLDEAAGNIPDPLNQVDAVNMAIGQGDILVTPLQVANFVAAIGNGGVLYKPQAVERVAPPDGKPALVFKPQVLGKLPVKLDNLNVIQQAMVGVIRNEKPRGTAWHIFTGLDIPVAGKTGTAQSSSDLPHAWFVGYTFAEREGKPDIAAAVLVENVGEGSDYAAPIFRRIVELYFSGQPQKLYWWESSYNVPISATPETEGTPGPVSTPLP
jgi:penicillin-binding protein 2